MSDCVRSSPVHLPSDSNIAILIHRNHVTLIVVMKQCTHTTHRVSLQLASLLAASLLAACSSDASQPGNSDDAGAMLDGAVSPEAGSDSGADGAVPGDMDAASDAGDNPTDAAVFGDAAYPSACAVTSIEHNGRARCYGEDTAIAGAGTTTHIDVHGGGNEDTCAAADAGVR